MWGQPSIVRLLRDFFGLIFLPDTIPFFLSLLSAFLNLILRDKSARHFDEVFKNYFFLRLSKNLISEEQDNILKVEVKKVKHHYWLMYSPNN